VRICPRKIDRHAEEHARREKEHRLLAGKRGTEIWKGERAHVGGKCQKAALPTRIRREGTRAENPYDTVNEAGIGELSFRRRRSGTYLATCVYMSRRKLTRSRYRRDTGFQAAYPHKASKTVVSPSPGIISPKVTLFLAGVVRQKSVDLAASLLT
jgi:hypothetical protein